MKEDFIGAAALAATGMMIPWMGFRVNRFFEIFLHACGVRVQKVQKLQSVQRGRWAGLIAPKVVAACRRQVVFASLRGATAPPALSILRTFGAKPRPS